VVEMAMMMSMKAVKIAVATTMMTKMKRMTINFQ
jgi:hypothetical protein